MPTTLNEFYIALMRAGTVALVGLLMTGCGSGKEPTEDGDAASPRSLDTETSGVVSTQAIDVNPLGLSEKDRGLLRSEMQQIQAATQRILPLMVQRVGTKAASIAKQIHESFILKQSLSPEELKELTGSLPKGFVKLDRSFHKKAKALAQAFQEDDYSEASRLYSQMVQSCVECHTSYAQERFPPR